MNCWLAFFIPNIMDFTQLEKNLKDSFNTKKIEIAVFKAIKKNPDIIMFYQRKQLFSDSIGSDGKALGFYAAISELYNKKKAKGVKFNMVSSGLFKRSLRLDVKYRHLIIRADEQRMADIQMNKSFETDNILGLTEASYRKLLRYRIKPIITKWMKTRT